MMDSKKSLWFTTFLRKFLTLFYSALLFFFLSSIYCTLLFFFLSSIFSYKKASFKQTLNFQIIQKSNRYMNKILYLHNIFKMIWHSSLVLPLSVTPVHDNFPPLLKRFGVYANCRKFCPKKVKPSNFHIYLLNVSWPGGAQVNVLRVNSAIGRLGNGGTIMAEIKVIDIWYIKIIRKIRNIFTKWKLWFNFI